MQASRTTGPTGISAQDPRDTSTGYSVHDRPGHDLEHAERTSHVGGGVLKQTDEHEHEKLNMANNREWQESQKYAHMAIKETATLERASKDLEFRREEADRLQREAEQARAQYERAIAQMRELEGSHGPVDLDSARRELELAKRAADAKTREADDMSREAKEATRLAHLKYEDAKRQLDLARGKFLGADELAKSAADRRRLLEEEERITARLSEEEMRLQRERDARRNALEGLRLALNDATNLIDLKAKELADARAFADGKNKQLEILLDDLRLAESNHRTHFGRLETHRRTLDTHVRDLRGVEEQLPALQQDADAARRAAQEKADLANAARDRAVDLRDTASEASRTVNEAKALAAEKAREAERLRRLQEEVDRKIVPVKENVNEAAKVAHNVRALAETKTEEWHEMEEKLNIHKGKTHELWMEAKQHGDRADENVAMAMRDMEAKLAGAQGDISGLEKIKAAAAKAEGVRSVNTSSSYDSSHTRNEYGTGIGGHHHHGTGASVAGAGAATGAALGAGHHHGMDTVGAGNRDNVNRVAGSYNAASNLGGAGTGTERGPTDLGITGTGHHHHPGAGAAVAGAGIGGAGVAADKLSRHGQVDNYGNARKADTGVPVPHARGTGAGYEKLSDGTGTNTPVGSAAMPGTLTGPPMPTGHTGKGPGAAVGLDAGAPTGAAAGGAGANPGAAGVYSSEADPGHNGGLRVTRDGITTKGAAQEARAERETDTGAHKGGLLSKIKGAFTHNSS